MTLMKADCHLGLSSLEIASEMDIVRRAPEVTLITRKAGLGRGTRLPGHAAATELHPTLWKP